MSDKTLEAIKKREEATRKAQGTSTKKSTTKKAESSK